MKVQPVLAGIVASIVGFASSFAVVLAGLRAIGADERQAASGLLALSVTMGLSAVYLGLRYRMPISIAWSTPGAALLATGVSEGIGYREALGAFAVTGVLLTLTGLSSRLGRLLAAIPVPLASAMLAGVLLPLCLAPVKAVAELPRAAVPIVLTWLVLGRFARTRVWAVPAALAVALAAIWLTRAPDAPPLSGYSPALAFEWPAFSVNAVIGIALPLYVVTMASQNIPGMGVMAANGYHPELRPVLATTGAGTVLGAPFGGHAINLAAITAQLVAGPDAHPDPDRRWPASVTGGACYLLLGLVSGLAVSFVSAAPPLLIESVAGLALFAALASSLHAAVQDPDVREAAVIALAVSASGITALGIGAPFWGLLAGLAYHRLASRPLRTRRPDGAAGSMQRDSDGKATGRPPRRP